MLTFCNRRVMHGILDSSDEERNQAQEKKFLTNVWRIMRITALLLLVGSLHVTARGVSQTITLKGNDLPLTTVFAEIEKQSGYVVIYNQELIQHAPSVTVDVKDEPLLEFLDATLNSRGLTYVLESKTIMLKKQFPTVGLNQRQFSPSGNTRPPIDVKGRVIDENGEPLEGVTLSVKGSNRATSTNANGEFEFREVNEDVAIIVSGVNIETREFKVNGRKSLTIAAIRKSSSLNEVIVNKGYYTEKQKYSVGNTGKISEKEIERQPINNPLLALQGKVAGVFIEQWNGLPGTGVSVRVQGQNSIRSGNDPLYVIDRVPYISQMPPNSLNNTIGPSGNPGANQTGNTGSGNPLNFINPNDIESIEILKDADATAIYGSLAANGAILITTKKGKAGKVRFNIDVQKGFGRVFEKLNLLKTPDYLKLRREAISNDGMSVDPNSDYDLTLWDSTRYTDWQHVLIGGTAKISQVQAAVSGGTNNQQFMLSGTYRRESTVFPQENDDQKKSLHFSINNTSLNQRFRLDFSGNYLVDDNNLPNQDLTFISSILAPNAPKLHNPDGSLNWEPNSLGISTWTNPLADFESKYKAKTTNLISNIMLTYKILPFLDVKTNFGYSNLALDENMTVPLTSKAPETRLTEQRAAIYNTSAVNSWIVEPQMSLTKKIGDGVLEALVGSSIHERNSKENQLLGLGYTSDQVMEDMRSASTILVIGSYYAAYRYNALFGRLNYNWKDRYVINMNVRRDGSNKFGPESRFHNFGSVGLAWVFSEEKIIKDLSFLSFGKLRASYGTTGNDQIGDYGYLNLYNSLSAYQGVAGLAVNGLTNKQLKWEETRKLQFGLELGFFHDRIFINSSYYRNRSSNQLLPYSLPFVTGFGSITSNFPALVENRGWEVTFHCESVKGKNFKWTTDVNLTAPVNKLVDFPNLSNSGYKNTLVVGQSVVSRKVAHFVQVDPATGDYQFLDNKGNITLSPDVFGGTDATVLVDLSPKFFGGIQNNIKYKSCELDFTFQFVKQKGPNYFYGNSSGVSFNINQPVYLLDRWQKPGDRTVIQPTFTYNNFSRSFSSLIAAQYSDAGYSDASYARLKNLSLSWQVPERWRRNLQLQNCKLYVLGQNLLTFTGYKGLDPETKSSIRLPPLRIISIGLQAGL